MKRMALKCFWVLMGISIQEQCISTCWRWNDMNYNKKKHVGLWFAMHAFFVCFYEYFFRSSLSRTILSSSWLLRLCPKHILLTTGVSFSVLQTCCFLFLTVVSLSYLSIFPKFSAKLLLLDDITKFSFVRMMKWVDFLRNSYHMEW